MPETRIQSVESPRSPVVLAAADAHPVAQRRMLPLGLGLEMEHAALRFWRELAERAAEDRRQVGPDPRHR